MVGKRVLPVVALGPMMVPILFAQVADGRLYPWGNEWDPATVPKLDKGRNFPPPSAVNSHPKGPSPFGLTDAE